MELTACEDIEAPLHKVFGLASNFDRLERQAGRNGIDVARLSPEGATPEQGLSWRARFRYRDTPREADIALTRHDPPNTMVFRTVSGGLEAVTTVDFVALSRTRTRVGVRIELLPRTLSARLMVQPLKLARGSVEKRFRAKMAGYAGDIEKRLNASG